MSLLRRLRGEAPRDPLDDRYYNSTPDVVQTHTGFLVNEDRAIRVGTVWRAVNVLAAAVAVLPLQFYRRLARGKEQVRDHPVAHLLRRPNALQTSYRWRHHLMGHVILGGNYYAQKVGGAGRPVEQLWPLDPARMAPVSVTPAGELRYQYTLQDGRPWPLDQRQVFHARGFTRNGYQGERLLDVMREAVGLALASEAHGANFMRNAARPSVVLTHPGELSPEAAARLSKEFSSKYAGPLRAGGIPVLEGGVGVTAFQVTSRDAQYIESRQFQVEELLRFLGVPGVLVGYADKTATYASAEQFFQSFVTHGIYPWVRNLEEELSWSLLDEAEQEEFAIEFNLRALLRPDSTARAAFYRAMVELGIMTRNEVRELENLNPLDGLDEPLTPANMNRGSDSQAAAPAQPKRAPAQSDPDEGDDGQDALAARARGIIQVAAARLVRQEVLAIAGDGRRNGAAHRFAANPSAWREWVADFYREHEARVRDTLQLDPAAAARYCAEQRAAVLGSGVSVVASWEESRVPALAGLVLGGATC